MDLQLLPQDLHRKIRDCRFLLEAKARADKEYVLPSHRRIDSETGVPYGTCLSADGASVEKENRGNTENKGVSDAFRECHRRRDLCQRGQTRELSVKRGVSKNKLRIAVAVDDRGHCMAKASGHGMPKSQDSEKDFGSLVEKGSSVTHDDSNYGNAFGGCLETNVNSKDRQSHRLMNPINRFCCQVQRIFAVHLRIHRSNVQKYLDTLCADYMSDKERFPEFLRENREKIFSSGIMLRRSDVYGCPATL